jgi:hypothetical protein
VILAGALVSGQGQQYGMFIEAVEANMEFDAVTEAVEMALNDSDFVLLNAFDASAPEVGADYRSRVFVFHDAAYTDAIGAFAGPHAAAAMFRINVYEFGPDKLVRVNFVNIETLACVYLFENGIDQAAHDNLLVTAAALNQNVLDLITSNVTGTVLNEQMGAIRSLEELHPYIGDGDAQVMVNFSDYAQNYQQGLVATFATFDEAVAFVETNLANANEGWELITTLDVGNTRLFGVTKGSVEAVSAEIVSDALGASEANPAPGINHNAAYPIEILVYEINGEFAVAYPAQMWRMMLYYWDAGIGAFVQYQTLPGEFDASLLAELGQ